MGQGNFAYGHKDENLVDYKVCEKMVGDVYYLSGESYRLRGKRKKKKDGKDGDDS